MSAEADIQLPRRSASATSLPGLEGAADESATVQEIRNELEFAQWYDTAGVELREATYEKYQSCLDELEMTTSHLDSLLRDSSSTLDLLSSLSRSFKAVETQTTIFQQQCEGLLSAEARSSKLADDIQENLQFYDYLDPASRRLNAPGAGNSVRRKDFSDMLRRLDECLDYMQAHPEQKEAETYRARYRLLLTRALTLIRGQFVSTLREISSGVSKRIADRQLNDTTMSALLYAKFRVGAAEMKDIGLEIQKRAVPPLDPKQGAEAEYQSLLNELHTNFSATRGKLIIPLVRKRLNDIANAPSTSKDLVAFARGSISYVRGICLDEFDLWGQWFHGQQGLYDFLESVCEPLYDHLRPRIIHETKLVKLCQLCTLLQTRYLMDPEEEAEYPNPNQLDFSALIQPALEDTQTRLVFRAQAILRDEIEKFKPKPEDLDYPARNTRVSLPGKENKQPVVSGKKQSHREPVSPVPKLPVIVDEELDSPGEKDPRWDFESRSVFEGWYPTLRKAVWLLSRIYRLVNQQIVAFDIEFVSPEVTFDFSGVTNTFWELRERGGLFNPRNLVHLLGNGLLPRVVENMLDAKVELDGRLRTVINDFTNSFAARMTAPLPSTVTAASMPQARAAVGNARQVIQKEVPELRRLLGNYITDTRTRETLVAAVQDNVIQLYEDFFQVYTSAESAGDRVVGRSNGKGRADEVWDVETFTDWSEGVFSVGIPKLEDPDEEVEDMSSDRSV
ncbi:conserved hypothetical protein [Uncinocarpus reesii 1704]|uniref:Conserved oligomeric Golgi complex subunit 3 n=1 Tax=Uncinocarpus reesii (strain UAMH 1704) TaxID=336963 RepID=C4JZ96_UNCRE|nr:uncharacterized protein UREG_07497 [Uncinocarpus reesii 1704]EEP82632.1 conserved hypothetical protein [Uncinocarpus reesii 1704]